MNQTISSGGTDNHLLLWDARPLSLTGSKLEKALSACAITANKNSLLGDVSAQNPGGVRLGTPALTSRGMKPDDMEQVAKFLMQAASAATSVELLCRQEGTGGSKDGKVTTQQFCEKLKSDKDGIFRGIRDKVERFSSSFYMPGQEI